MRDHQRNAAVCVVAESAGRLRILATRDPDGIRQGDKTARILWLAWCQSEKLATEIPDDAGYRSATRLEDAVRAVEAAAAHREIKLSEHANVMRRLQQAVDHVTRQLDDAQARGELTWFNQAYRQWGIRAKHYGMAMPYAEARARLRKALFAQAMSGKLDNAAAKELLPAVFPSLLPPVGAGKCSWLHVVGKFLRAARGRAGCDPVASEWHLSVWVDP